MVNTRTQALMNWLTEQFPQQTFTVENMSGDAGFRRYFRLTFNTDKTNIIAVDAPPELSNNHAFVALSFALSQANVLVPKVLKQDLNQGFLCLTDLGNHLLSEQLSVDNMALHYQQAIDTLLSFMAISPKNIRRETQYNLPVYDQPFIATELAIFPQWLLDKHLGLSLSEQEQISLNRCFDVLIDNALAQPFMFMHRDYHSRNIMLADTEIAVIDFQDAVFGPVTYDIVSLLRDCYVRWPDEKIVALFDYFKQQMLERFGINETPATWQRWFDLMGLQRHIKASGIFARLYHRDEKNGYLDDIPLTLGYIIDIAEKYPELYFLHCLVKEKVLPAISNRYIPVPLEDAGFSWN